MAGVQKRDMHVSFHPDRLVVTWRRVKVTERMENSVLVRERNDRQYAQTIPLPEGTKVRAITMLWLVEVKVLYLLQFQDVRASRDGERLVLQYPNARCLRIQSPVQRGSSSKTSSSVSSVFLCQVTRLSVIRMKTIYSETEFQTCKLAPSTLETFGIERV